MNENQGHQMSFDPKILGSQLSYCEGFTWCPGMRWVQNDPHRLSGPRRTGRLIGADMTCTRSQNGTSQHLIKPMAFPLLARGTVEGVPAGAYPDIEDAATLGVLQRTLMATGRVASLALEDGLWRLVIRGPQFEDEGEVSTTTFEDLSLRYVVVFALLTIWSEG